MRKQDDQEPRVTATLEDEALFPEHGQPAAVRLIADRLLHAENRLRTINSPVSCLFGLYVLAALFILIESVVTSGCAALPRTGVVELPALPRN